MPGWIKIWAGEKKRSGLLSFLAGKKSSKANTNLRLLPLKKPVVSHERVNVCDSF